MKKLSLLLAFVMLMLTFGISASAAGGSDILSTAELYLSFDEDLTDKAGNYTVTEVGDVPYVEGKYGKAANTSMGTNYLAIDGLGQAFGTGSFTVTTWIKANAYITASGAGDCMLFGNTDWSASGNVAGWGVVAYSAAGGNGLTLHSVFGDGSGDPTVDDSFWSNKLRQDYKSGYGLEAVWTHISLVVDAADKTYTLYVNGEQYGTPYCYGDLFDGVQNDYASLYSDDLFCIGNDGNGGYNTQEVIGFNVDFDEFAIFNKALTADQVAAVYQHDPNQTTPSDSNSESETTENTESTETTEVTEDSDTTVPDTSEETSGSDETTKAPDKTEDTSGTEEDTSESGGSGNNGMWIAIVIAAVVVLAVVAVILVKKLGKKA